MGMGYYLSEILISEWNNCSVCLISVFKNVWSRVFDKTEAMIEGLFLKKLVLGPR